MTGEIEQYLVLEPTPVPGRLIRAAAEFQQFLKRRVMLELKPPSAHHEPGPGPLKQPQVVRRGTGKRGLAGCGAELGPWN